SAAKTRLQKLPDLQVGAVAAGPTVKTDHFALAIHPQAKVVGPWIGDLEYDAFTTSIHFANLQGRGVFILARGAPVLREFLGRIKLRAIGSHPKLIGVLIFLLLEQGQEMIERPLLGPIAEIKERRDSRDNGYQAPEDNAVSEPFSPRIGYSVL